MCDVIRLTLCIGTFLVNSYLPFKHSRITFRSPNMDYKVFEKNILITGAANGIGAFVVQYLVEEGVKNIYMLDVDEIAGHQLKEDLNTKIKQNVVKFMKCDVSQEDQLFSAFEEALKDCGYIDVVINNAGLADESSPAKIRKLVEVNYLAVVNLTLKALESMRKDHGGRGGTVLNVSSVVALGQFCPARFIYMGSKSAVMQFSNCIGRPEYYSKTGVRVLTICFGRTDTSILGKALSFDEIINKEWGAIVDQYQNQRMPSQFTKFLSLKVHSREGQRTHSTFIEDNYGLESPGCAARCVLTAIKSGESGSTWLSSKGKPAEDISQSITKAYGIMTQTFS